MEQLILHCLLHLQLQPSSFYAQCCLVYVCVVGESESAADGEAKQAAPSWEHRVKGREQDHVHLGEEEEEKQRERRKRRRKGEERARESET